MGLVVYSIIGAQIANGYGSITIVLYCRLYYWYLWRGSPRYAMQSNSSCSKRTLCQHCAICHADLRIKYTSNEHTPAVLSHLLAALLYAFSYSFRMGLPVFNYQNSHRKNKRGCQIKEINTIKGIIMLEQMGKNKPKMLHLSWLNSPLLKKLCIIHCCRTTPTTSTAYLAENAKILNLLNKMDYRCLD